MNKKKINNNIVCVVIFGNTTGGSFAASNVNIDLMPISKVAVLRYTRIIILPFISI